LKDSNIGLNIPEEIPHFLYYGEPPDSGMNMGLPLKPWPPPLQLIPIPNVVLMLEIIVQQPLYTHHLPLVQRETLRESLTLRWNLVTIPCSMSPDLLTPMCP